ncbi:Glycerophosphodiester phosphodiesterase GDPDL4 [Striga hermonthica]|uniref:glycerophosphodiester phosphodiesterase n=1 Tax=Striga hermonthica TaxID=68872 RepID=A0A9N7RKR4_STRHE|nr:Glycerophosphodiester phosphodiesterase GDPDL4 [Striga hermonthica]
MWKLRSVFGFFCFLLLCSSPALVSGQRSRRGATRWQTLSGDPPLVLARGGFSGVFPDSSTLAYTLAVQMSLQNSLVLCDVKLTRDGVGICFPSIMLQNASDADMKYPNRSNTYDVNGVQMEGYFTLDFDSSELANVTLKEGIFSRPPYFDDVGLRILTPQLVYNPPSEEPAGLWLNIQYDAFFSQHNLSMRSYVLSLFRPSSGVVVSFISSPEVGFLRSIRNRVGTTRLVFLFLGPTDTEPTTNQTYSSFLNNLTAIRTFADGIIVPKNYIWPVDNRQYLLNYTSLVADAHRAGLEVFASGFANDANLPYNYSFDPVSEYLSFIDNGQFSVDGVLSDFPLTPSATIDCYSHMRRNDSIIANITIISSEGASGDYPGCTDVAYRKAASDGADILDCPVQMTRDGVPFCLGSIDLRNRTNVAQSPLANRATDNPDLHIQDGIFTYNLTWSEIQTLRPAISNPYVDGYALYRNPIARNDGNLMQLSDFLAFANNQSSVSGILISIENAAYLAENQGLGVTDAVLSALSLAGYNNQTSKRVLIESSDSSVLTNITAAGVPYELVYDVDEDVGAVPDSTISEIQRFAQSVVVSKISVFPSDELFVKAETNVVERLQRFNLTVYVRLFRNEYPSQAWDFLSDPYVEINNYVAAKGINGLITEFPATANRYRRNRCLGYNVSDAPAYTQPVPPGGLIGLMSNQNLPPAEPPLPVLTDVTEPPLPPVILRPPPGNPPPAQAPAPPNSQPKTLVASTNTLFVLLLLVAFVL